MRLARGFSAMQKTPPKLSADATHRAGWRDEFWFADVMAIFLLPDDTTQPVIQFRIARAAAEQRAQVVFGDDSRRSPQGPNSAWLDRKSVV